VPCTIVVYEKQAAAMCFPPLVFGQEYNFQLSSDYVTDMFFYLSSLFGGPVVLPKVPNEFSLTGFFNDPELITMGMTLFS